MKYKCISIFQIKGITLHKEENIELLNDSATSIRAILTKQPNSYCFENDHCIAVCMQCSADLLRQPESSNFEKKVDERIKKIQQEREKESQDDSFLIIEKTGMLDNFNPEIHKQYINYDVIYLEDSKKDYIHNLTIHFINSVLLALALEAKEPLIIKENSGSIIFYKEENRPIYPFSILLLPLKVFGTTVIEGDTIKQVNNYYKALTSGQLLDIIVKLTILSLEFDEDILHSFLAAWTALEIFINTVYKDYETFLSEELNKNNHSQFEKTYLRLKEKYKEDRSVLLKRFIKISVQLNPANTEDDIDKFHKAKDLRNDLFHHNREVDEKDLPVESVKKLVKKYLKLHLLHKKKAKTYTN